jgi:hypothetical protein
MGAASDVICDACDGYGYIQGTPEEVRDFLALQEGKREAHKRSEQEEVAERQRLAERHAAALKREAKKREEGRELEKREIERKLAKNPSSCPICGGKTEGYYHGTRMWIKCETCGFEKSWAR